MGPVLLLLTLIRLVLCVRSILYHRKEKLLGAVVAELIKVKCQVIADLYDLKLTSSKTSHNQAGQVSTTVNLTMASLTSMLSVSKWKVSMSKQNISMSRLGRACGSQEGPMLAS